MDMKELSHTKDDPLWDQEPTKTTYAYPFPHAKKIHIAESQESHIGLFKHALDFLVLRSALKYL